MLLGKSSFIIALIALISPAACTPTQETNAQRMARGLPPSPPKFGRNVPGRIQVRQPTPVWAAKRHGVSPLPPVSYAGRIEVRYKDGRARGFVRNSNSSWTIGGVNDLGAEQDLHVSLTAPHSGKGPFDILATNPSFPEPFYVGAAGTNFISSLDLTSRNTIAFTNVQQTPGGSVPVSSTFKDNLLVESAIWSINPDTKEITGQWINPDKSSPATVIAYDIRANKIFFVGNIDAYNTNNDTPADTIKLFIVPI
ncbi:hypothetical protein Hypma_012022 [Hypsizygus marmoreus]|uniref:Uncharacterized protein n=1 Tax=Hypsizygus marmoreus TaxID=39966 RepID=A0A369JF93_HYPMA|nr:hypothetical protein Hypma_012022 [Hypsizygus marmoreus]